MLLASCSRAPLAGAALFWASACGGAQAPRDRPVEPPSTAASSSASSSSAPPSAPPVAAPAVDRRPRLTSVGYFTTIWPKPNHTEHHLGYVRFGESVVLKRTDLIPGEGCVRGYYAIEPRGYVCADAKAAVELPEARRKAFAALALGTGAAPLGWGLSDRAPMYNRLPTQSEWARAERGFVAAGAWQKLHHSHAAHEELAGRVALRSHEEPPPWLHAGKPPFEERIGLVRKEIPLGSMLSFTSSFASEGRTFLVSSDLTFVPADRIRPFTPSAFRGVSLGTDVTLPLAWTRRQPASLVRLRDGGVEPTAETLGKQSYVGLTGRAHLVGRKRYLETKRSIEGAPLFVAEADVSLLEAVDKLPFQVKAHDKWIQVQLSKGTLVAYEGLTPRYATLMSAGKGGLPRKGGDPVQDSTTPTGTWRVTFKDRVNHMSPDTDPAKRTFWIADVPWILYFNAPFAVHGAFWHERFGDFASAGCVNVSVADGKWLFDWSDPPIPEGWGGVTGAAAPQNGPTTIVVVTR